MFWVTSVKRSPSARSSATSASWPAFGARVLARRRSGRGTSARPRPAPARTSRASPSPAACSSASRPPRSPPLPRKVGIPLSAEMPAPVRATTLPCAARGRRARMSRELRLPWLTASHSADRVRPVRAPPGGYDRARVDRRHRRDPGDRDERVPAGAVASRRRRRWLFTYTVRIANEGDGARPARRAPLDHHRRERRARGGGGRGRGRAAAPPRARARHFEYTSFCVLETPHGSMRGTYRMVRDDGTTFEARIAPFALVVPGAVN